MKRLNLKRCCFFKETNIIVLMELKTLNLGSFSTAVSYIYQYCKFLRNCKDGIWIDSVFCKVLVCLVEILFYMLMYVVMFVLSICTNTYNLLNSKRFKGFAL